MGVYLQTTDVPMGRSRAEIEALLQDAGARTIVNEFGPDRRPCGVTFMLVINGAELPFRLPIRTERVFAVLQRQRKPPFRQKAEARDRDQAERIAWRQVAYWLRAQLALVDTGMVQPAEVLMPYIRLASGQTWYERLEATQFKALPAPADE